MRWIHELLRASESRFPISFATSASFAVEIPVSDVGQSRGFRLCWVFIYPFTRLPERRQQSY